MNRTFVGNCLCFYSSIKTEAVLFFLVGNVDFSGKAILCFFFYKMQYFQRKFPWHFSFIVHSHLKKSEILHILKKIGKIIMY